MHLPGHTHHKIDMSDKLEFVVVFQTIEIERLSEEVEALRVQIKDADRQLNNYKSYEIQIMELTENAHQQEESIKNYQNELEKMSLACNALYE
jgi:predicted RNase H-like nuclease (RuvC/YqgF family)